MEVVMLKSPHGALVPMDENEADKTRKWKAGAVIVGDYVEMRNGAFFRKWWALAKLAYEMWEDDLPELEYKGQPVRPEFERFRKDLIIMTGRFKPVFAANGEMRLVADSISWAKMDEPKFERLYSETINVILSKVLASKRLTEAQLRDAVDVVVRFS